MNHLLVIAILFLFSSCVTVDLPSSKLKSAENVNFVGPEAPFESSNTSTSDQLWISKRTGNSISYLSECQSNQELALEQIENDALSTLQELKILDSQKIDYNNREALKTTALGKVDGVLVMMRILTLKKNNCSYTLVYGGIKKNFETEINQFETFLKGFKAP